MTSTFAPRVLLLSSCLRGNAGSRCGEPWTPGPSRTWPRPGLFVRSQLCTLCWPALLRRISGALSTRPQRRRRRWPDSKKVKLTTRVDALRSLSKPVHERTPRSWRGLASATCRQTWGVGAFRRRGTAGSERRPCAHTSAVPWACGSGFSHAASAGVRHGR